MSDLAVSWRGHMRDAYLTEAKGLICVAATIYPSEHKDALFFLVHHISMRPLSGRIMTRERANEAAKELSHLDWMVSDDEIYVNQKYQEAIREVFKGE